LIVVRVITHRHALAAGAADHTCRGRSNPPDSWYLGDPKTSVMTSGARSMCFRRTSSGAGSCGVRLPIGWLGPVALRPSGRTCGWTRRSGKWPSRALP